MSELSDFNWDVAGNNKKLAPIYQPSIIGIMDDETYNQRTSRMLLPLSTSCLACSMCDLGIKTAQRDGDIRDPHVFSNMNPSRFMIVGQNPGWNEVRLREPFVGQSGDNFNSEISKHGMTRKDFYITNIVKCYTADNKKPTQHQIDMCSPFLQMEINLLKPLLVITLGAPAFGLLCPDNEYSQSLKKITKSQKFNIPVFAVYHPSPLNMTDKDRKQGFIEQIGIMCGLVKALKAKHGLD